MFLLLVRQCRFYLYLDSFSSRFWNLAFVSEYIHFSEEVRVFDRSIPFHFAISILRSRGTGFICHLLPFSSSMWEPTRSFHPEVRVLAQSGQQPFTVMEPPPPPLPRSLVVYSCPIVVKPPYISSHPVDPCSHSYSTTCRTHRNKRHRIIQVHVDTKKSINTNNSGDCPTITPICTPNGQNTAPGGPPPSPPRLPWGTNCTCRSLTGLLTLIILGGPIRKLLPHEIVFPQGGHDRQLHN